MTRSPADCQQPLRVRVHLLIRRVFLAAYAAAVILLAGAWAYSYWRSVGISHSTLGYRKSTTTIYHLTALDGGIWFSKTRFVPVPQFSYSALPFKPTPETAGPTTRARPADPTATGPGGFPPGSVLMPDGSAIVPLGRRARAAREAAGKLATTQRAARGDLAPGGGASSNDGKTSIAVAKPHHPWYVHHKAFTGRPFRDRSPPRANWTGWRFAGMSVERLVPTTSGSDTRFTFSVTVPFALIMCAAVVPGMWLVGRRAWCAGRGFAISPTAAMLHENASESGEKGTSPKSN